MNTKTALLDSAETFVRSRGFDAFSFADLSKEVGIRKASIHHHFPTKADLAKTLVDRYAQSFLARLSEVSTSRGTGADKLRAYLTLYRDALSDGDSLCLCVAFASTPESFDKDVHKSLSAFHEASINWLTDVFETAQKDGSVSHINSPQDDAAATLALVEGAQIMARSKQDTAVFDQATASLQTRLS